VGWKRDADGIEGRCETLQREEEKEANTREIPITIGKKDNLELGTKTYIQARALTLILKIKERAREMGLAIDSEKRFDV